MQAAEVPQLFPEGSETFAGRTLPNPSGLHPKGRAVLVLPAEMEAVRKRGTIIIPENVKQSAALLENKVRVVAIGAMAWSDETEPRARIGDTVLVTKFAGFQCLGADGKVYRLVNDRDIFCVIEFEREEKGDE